MPIRIKPGVDVEEVSYAGVPIAGLESGVTAFIHEFATGPFHRPVETRSVDDVEATFGPSTQLTAFFNNGGRRAWVVRIDAAERDSLRKACAALADLPLDAFDLVCVPPMCHMPPGAWDEVFDIVEALAASHGAFMIVDPPLVKGRPMAPVDLLAWLSRVSRHAAMVTPRPILHGEPVSVSGPVAGIYARMDEALGVWKAPAGIEASVLGIDSVENLLTTEEISELNISGVVPLRVDPRHGIIVWGSRTLGDAEPRYVGTSRIQKHIEVTVRTGLAWTVFEPNDEPLWASLRHHVGEFLEQLWRRGALAGSTSSDAYFVRCDRATTTPADIDRGVAILQLGFAPLQPAEFVVVYVEIQTQT